MSDATTAAEPASAAPEPCTLVEDTDLAAVFPGGAPVADGNDYGTGFAECTWEDDTAQVLVSVLPVADFQSDYAGQLNVTGPVDAPELGEDAVSFPGVVGIGKGSGGGASVGFTTETTAVMVAVRTGDGDPTGDLALATALAVAAAEAV